MYYPGCIILDILILDEVCWKYIFHCVVHCVCMWRPVFTPVLYGIGQFSTECSLDVHSILDARSILDVRLMLDVVPGCEHPGCSILDVLILDLVSCMFLSWMYCP